MIAALPLAAFNIETIHQALKEFSADNIASMEEFCSELPQTAIPVKNGNANGMYTREILIPKDTFLTGRVHLFDYVDIMLSGDITVLTDEGFKRFRGANIFDGKAGRKRAGYAHEDTRWITVHRVDISDGDFFYDYLTVQSILDYENLASDRADYFNLLDDLRINQESIDKVVKNTNDMMNFPAHESGLVDVLDSHIHGKGLFAAKNFSQGEKICSAAIGGLRTPAGRYSNHSICPNAEMKINGDGFDLYATEYITEGYEITTNYRHTMKIRGVLCQE